MQGILVVCICPFVGFLVVVALKYFYGIYRCIVKKASYIRLLLWRFCYSEVKNNQQLSLCLYSDRCDITSDFCWPCNLPYFLCLDQLNMCGFYLMSVCHIFQFLSH